MRAPSRLRLRIPCLVAAAAACAVIGAACGSSGISGRKNSAAHASAFLAYSECMRSHGVPNFPDPSSRGGIQLSSSSGINPFSPSVKAAQKDCHKLLPGGGPGGFHPSAQAKAQALRISECMRSHGVTGFPDPTSTPPSSPQGYAIIENNNGVVLAVPSSINPDSPAFKQAGNACGFR